MLRGRKTKHWMRTLYALRSLWSLKRGLLRDSPERDYWQAGKSVAGVDAIEPAGDDRAAVRKRVAGVLQGRLNDSSVPTIKTAWAGIHVCGASIVSTHIRRSP